MPNNTTAQSQNAAKDFFLLLMWNYEINVENIVL